MDKQKLENMIAALEIFYETAGYEDFYGRGSWSSIMSVYASK